MTQRFHEYKMESNDTVSQHISKVQNMAAQLNDVGEAVSDVAIMAKILASLPPRFNALKTAWDSVELERKTLENLQERLLKEETRSLADDGAMSAFATATKNAKNALKKDAKNMANVESFNFRKKGHFAWQCPNKKKKKNDFMKKNDERNDKSDECAFIITDREESPHLIERFDKMDVSDVWLLDSGASRHISFKREWFTDFSITSGEYVMLGDNGECEVRGVGTVKIRKFVNNEWFSSTIENVLYVPKLRKNLFSVGMCAARGYNVTFSEKRVVISRRGEIIVEGAKQANAIYRMFFAVLSLHGDCETEINVSESSADLKLWHERFGHAGKNTLKKMFASGFVN